jgi:hypothetical protein
MSKPILIYSIDRNYRKATVWSADPVTRKLFCTSTCTLNKGLKFRERSVEIVTWLKERFDITPC